MDQTPLFLVSINIFFFTIFVISIIPSDPFIKLSQSWYTILPRNKSMALHFVGYVILFLLVLLCIYHCHHHHVLIPFCSYYYEMVYWIDLLRGSIVYHDFDSLMKGSDGIIEMTKKNDGVKQIWWKKICLLKSKRGSEWREVLESGIVTKFNKQSQYGDEMIYSILNHKPELLKHCVKMYGWILNKENLNILILNNKMEATIAIIHITPWRKMTYKA